MTTNDSCRFTFENNQVAYRIFGDGPVALLAFHGFGQSSSVFASTEKLLGSRFTIYAIDLFFHGNSQYGNQQLLTKADWHNLVSTFLQVHRIDRFSVLGFSLGARFALTVVESFADQLDQVILLAPDGITRNGWYVLATGSWLGRSLFQYVLRHLSMLTGLGHALTRIGLLNRTVMRFAEMSLATPEQRTLVYKSWTQFRLINPDLETISNRLNQSGSRILIFTGAFDRLVPGTYILPLTQKLYYYELTVLKTGHNRLIELAADSL